MLSLREWRAAFTLIEPSQIQLWHRSAQESTCKKGPSSAGRLLSFARGKGAHPCQFACAAATASSRETRVRNVGYRAGLAGAGGSHGFA
jgi:hypothetical protein